MRNIVMLAILSLILCPLAYLGYKRFFKKVLPPIVPPPVPAHRVELLALRSELERRLAHLTDAQEIARLRVQLHEVDMKLKELADAPAPT